MEDAARDLGLAYANSFPLVLASVVVPLIAIAWLAVKAKDLDESIRTSRSSASPLRLCSS
jgi:ABC-type spermidine/putrescine transport system permease subunit II